MTLGSATDQPPRPAYVDEALSELASVDLKLVKPCASQQPSRAPTLISVVKDETSLLPDFLRHYREAGIERFIFIDNGSSDGTLEFLTEQSDATVYLADRPFSWQRKQGWIMRAIALSRQKSDWFLYVDADEHVVFDGIGRTSFADLTQTMDALGISRVRGMLLDMYPEGPILESTYRFSGRLLESYPYFDREGYVEAKFKEIISRKGGPRKRAFGHVEKTFRPELTKYPLFKLSDGDVFANPHHVWPYEANFVSPCYLGILHFKFLPGVLGKINKAVAEGTYFNNSLEYRCYQQVLQSTPRLSLHSDVSARYAGPDDLIANDIIVPAVRPGRAMWMPFAHLMRKVASSSRIIRMQMRRT